MRRRWRKWRLNDATKTTKYVKNSGHKKKNKKRDPDAKTCWRQEKQTKRDKSKPHWSDSSRKQWARSVSSAMRRQYFRRLIHHENWDILHNVDHCFFNDPWIWD